MANAITNTSPLIYLHQIQCLGWLSRLFEELWIPSAVVDELREGEKLGYRGPDVGEITGARIVQPKSQPIEWLSADLGPGELAAITLGIEIYRRRQASDLGAGEGALTALL